MCENSFLVIRYALLPLSARSGLSMLYYLAIA